VKRMVHIRHEYPKISKVRWLADGGPQATTFCAAEPSCYDVAYNEEPRRWILPQTGILYYPCEPCVRLREEAR